MRATLPRLPAPRVCDGVRVTGGDDLHFWFDPVCPFAWLTSRWVRLVAEQRSYAVTWRPISLRLLNAAVDYDAQFPPDYAASHTAGLRLLRVVDRVREEHGPEAVGPLYETLGSRVFGRTPEEAAADPGGPGRPGFAAAALADAGLPTELVEALDDTSRVAALQAETDAALALAGRDVGTPVLHFRPPTGTAFFGPVISRLPSPEQAVELWDHVVALAEFPGFAELKRSLRETPQLRSFGVEEGTVGGEEDWHGGSRRRHR
jgi:2-hydroxychromene-2-carboxylate isomerase